MSCPWMPLYVADFLTDTLHLSAEETGVYMLMMMLAWRRPNCTLPNDMAWLKRSLSACAADMHGNRFNKIVPKIIAEFWQETNGELFQKRLRSEWEKAKIFSGNQRENAKKRWAKDKENKDLAHADAMPARPLQSQSQSQSQEIIDADASIVDVPVDLSPVDEKKKALREALQSFGEQWNNLASAYRLPTIDEIRPGSTRERHALSRLREMEADGVQALMARVRGSAYLRGEVNDFRCTFDWIVNPANFQKIMEGNYENRKVTPFRR